LKVVAVVFLFFFLSQVTGYVRGACHDIPGLSCETSESSPDACPGPAEDCHCLCTSSIMSALSRTDFMVLCRPITSLNLFDPICPAAPFHEVPVPPPWPNA
jgi:hypothetical protein